ncbi:hypothetical protein O9X98_08715 [Agrobacterium salinitolerans]|nr:hypothetical protein [Agrobacterium salinitolerans]
MRPFISHAQLGADAYLNGKTEADNPHRDGTSAHIEWLGGHLNAKVESGDLNADDQDCATVYLGDTVIEARRQASRLRLDLPTATAVADAIDLPVRKWKGKCFAISVAALESGVLDEFQEKHGKLFPAYGMYDGPLAEGRRPFNRHGWLESLEGHVVDPTRWVFTDEYPHLWAGPLDDYDLGGMRLRHGHRSTRPPAPEGIPIRLGINDRRDLMAFDRVLRGNSVSSTGMIFPNELHWVVTSSLEQLGADASLFIKTADRLGVGGLVPVDTRLWLDFSQNGYDPDKLRQSQTDIPDQPKAKAPAAPTFSPF